MAAQKRLSDAALEVLGSMVTEDNLAKFGDTHVKLERGLYVECNKALEAIGGKWNKKRGGHVFEADPRDELDQIVLIGGFLDHRQEFGFFETPDELADEIVAAASITAGDDVLEPSAGRGAILRAIDRAHGLDNSEPSICVVAVEIQSKNAAFLRSQWVGSGKNGQVVQHVEGDFLAAPELAKKRFDRIVMNPPFARQADIAHVTRAWELLAPVGRLVSIMAAGIEFRQDRKSTELRSLIKAHGTLTKLPPESFRSSGTDVNTVVVTLDKPA